MVNLLPLLDQPDIWSQRHKKRCALFFIFFFSLRDLPWYIDMMIIWSMPMGDASTLFGCCQFSVYMAAQPWILCLYSREGTCIESKFVKDVLCLTDTFLELPAKISELFSFTPKIRRCFSSLSFSVNTWHQLLNRHAPPTSTLSSALKNVSTTLWETTKTP